jgi:hypothetical protein
MAHWKAVRTCASSCRRLGLLLASTTRDFLNSFRHGRSNGGGGGRSLGAPGFGAVLCGRGDCRASSYDGGGSEGSSGSLTSIAAVVRFD